MKKQTIIMIIIHYNGLLDARDMISNYMRQKDKQEASSSTSTLASRGSDETPTALRT